MYFNLIEIELKTAYLSSDLYLSPHSDVHYEFDVGIVVVVGASWHRDIMISHLYVFSIRFQVLGGHLVVTCYD